jgi:hypothetical protein
LFCRFAVMTWHFISAGCFVYHRLKELVLAAMPLNYVRRKNLSFFMSLFLSHSRFRIRQLTPWHQNLNIHHHIYNSPPPAPVLSQFNPLHPPPPQPISLRPILIPFSHLHLGPPSGLSFRLSQQNFVHYSLISHACHMLRPPRPNWLVCIMIFGD